jgi:hypothetical protein
LPAWQSAHISPLKVGPRPQLPPMLIGATQRCRNCALPSAKRCHCPSSSVETGIE